MLRFPRVPRPLSTLLATWAAVTICGALALLVQITLWIESSIWHLLLVAGPIGAVVVALLAGTIMTIVVMVKQRAACRAAGMGFWHPTSADAWPESPHNATGPRQPRRTGRAGQRLARIRDVLAPQGMWGAYLKARGIPEDTARARIERAQSNPAAGKLPEGTLLQLHEQGQGGPGAPTRHAGGMCGSASPLPSSWSRCSTQERRRSSERPRRRSR